MRLMMKSSSRGEFISCGHRPALRPPASWHQPQPLLMNRLLPSSIWAAVSVGAEPDDSCSAAHTEAGPNTAAQTATVNPTVALITMDRFMILRLPRPTRPVDQAPRGFKSL